MTKLILIRHSETDYNLESRYCGYSNLPLNNKGIWQAQRLSVRLKDIKIDRVYSSDLKRAYQTAEIIFKNNSIERMADFREMNFGIFEGLKYEDIIKKHPKLYRNWINDPMKIKIPNGEGLKDLSKRVKERLSSILSKYEDKTLALVTHGGPIRIILCDVLKYNLKMFWQMEQEVGALNIIDYDKGFSPDIIKMNDISHLSIKEEITL